MLADVPLIRDAPPSDGTVEMVVARPDGEERTVLARGVLDTEVGLVGDNWLERGSRHTEDGSAEAERQLTLMNSRAVAAITGTRDRWPLAGDQIYVDLDLSTDNLPAGTEVQVGEAVIEITALPHTGCAKFARRFGADATRFVNSPDGKALNLRGVNATVVTGGSLAPGDPVIVRSRPEVPGAR